MYFLVYLYEQRILTKAARVPRTCPHNLVEFVGKEDFLGFAVLS
jgi:hypothetical protein